MRSKETILREIKKAEKNRNIIDSVNGILIPLSYIDFLKLEYVCTSENTTVQEIISIIIDEKLKKFEGE